jgi:hypothetical protein
MLYMYLIHVGHDMTRNDRKVREQAVVYLGQRDRALLDALADKTGLSRTELFRRGLWALAAQIGAAQESGSAFDYLVSTATQFTGPPDFAERSDEYLYGGRTWLEPAAPAVAETKSAATKRSRKRADPR